MLGFVKIKACHGSVLVGRPIDFCFGDPRPGLTHEIVRGWGATRPAYHSFNFSRPDPARPITFSKSSALPGPAHHIGSEAHDARAPYGPAHQ